MKIDIDGFVPYANSQEYQCARGCAGCSSAKRKDHPELIIDDDFYQKIGSFIRENRVTYKSISLNCCGDFLENFTQFQSLLSVLHRFHILRKGTKILCYTSIESIGNFAHQISLLEKFDGLLEFQIGIPYSLSEGSIHSDFSYEQIGGRKPSNLSYHIVLQQKHGGTLSQESKEILRKNIARFACNYPITLAESEGEILTPTEIDAGLFFNGGLQKCPFAGTEYMKIDDENLDLYMFDISSAGLRPHGPGCEKNPHLLIGGLDDDIHRLHLGARKLQEALQKLNTEYSALPRSEYHDICSFCRKNVKDFLSC